jgi:glycosyltransferase involved in cell wall biosynthesis
MIKINLCGQMFGASGYANHFRNFLRSLLKVADVKVETQLVSGFEAFVNDEELEAIKKSWHKDGVTYVIGMPNSWKNWFIEDSVLKVGCCVWEGDKLPVGFKEGLGLADKIVVPSSHTKFAIINTFPEFANKIVLVPHGVNTLDFQPKEKLGSKFVFLANKGLSLAGKFDRGGLYYLLKAYSEEFRKEENVCLKIKINMSYFPQGANPLELINSWGINKDHAEIMINPDFVDYKFLPEFYNGDVFVSPTMAEAFSLPCLESMSCGIPVITTNYGGQTDFVNESNGWLINSKLVEVEHDVMYEGVSWSEPSIEHLRKLMRYAFEHEGIVKTKGLAARRDALKLSWDNSVYTFLESIK